MKSKLTITDILYVCLLTAMRPISAFSPDQYFMTAHGEDMLKNGLTHPVDIFTVHNLDFTYQKWAMCILTKGLSRLGDIGFTIAAFALFFALLLSLLYALKKINPEKTTLNYCILFIVAFCIMLFAQFRPHMIAGILLVITLLLMEEFIKNEKKIHYLYFLLISVAMMWFHSTMWVVLPIFLLPYLCDFAFLKTPWEVEDDINKKSVLKALAVILFGSLLQPNGIGEYKYLYVCMTATSDAYRVLINELRPDYLSSMNVCVYVLFILGIGLIIKNKKYRLRAVFMLLGGLLMTLMAIRMCIYSAVIMAFGIALNCQLYEFKMSVKAKKATRVLLYITCILIAAVMIGFAGSQYEENMGRSGVIAINTLPKNSTVFCSTMDAGSYAMMKGHKVYIDCRAELYDKKLNGKKDYLTEYLYLICGQYKGNDSDTYMKDFHEDYDFDYYVISWEGIMMNKSLEKCATIVYKDEFNTIYKFTS